MVSSKTWCFPVSAYRFILLQPLPAYFKQPELPLAPSFTLASLCQALLLLVSLSLLLNTSSSQKCCLLTPSASLARYAVKPAYLLQTLWPTSCSHTTACFLLQPPMANMYQPEVLLAASFTLSDLCHEAKPARLLQPLLAYITLRST